MQVSDKDIADQMILRVLRDHVGEWVTAQDVSEFSGWTFKAVVWSLTRLSRGGCLEVRLTNYAVPYRRGSGEQRNIYRLPVAMPQWLSASVKAPKSVTGRSPLYRRKPQEGQGADKSE